MSSSPDQFYAPYSCLENASQEVTRVICQKLSSSISILGSSYILALVYKKWKHDRSRVDPYQRIMAGYSIFDILYSFFYWFLGSWMTPNETGWYGAVGNTATCTMQGFFFFIGSGTAMYQFTLSLQMLLLVTFVWTPQKFERLLEYKLHTFIGVFAVIFSSIPLFFGGYNPQCGMCLVAPLPYWCGNWVHLGDGTTECERGNDLFSHVYRIIFWFFISSISLFCTGAMVSVYRSVYLEEQRMVQYRFQNEEEAEEGKASNSESKRIQKTLLLYTSSFYICWITPVVFWNATSVPALHIVGDMLFSMMGFFNMVVFIQPKCIKYQTEHPDCSLVACYFYVIFSEQIKFGQRFTGIERTDEINFDDGIGFETYNHRLSECPEDDEDEDTPPSEPKNDGARRSSFSNANEEFVNANADAPPR